MHVKWNRNLDGIRPPSSLIGTLCSSEIASSLNYNSSKSFHSPVQDSAGSTNEDHYKSKMSDSSRLLTSKSLAKISYKKDERSWRHSSAVPLPLLSSQSNLFDSSQSSNRITSKGALSTLISLFGFRNDNFAAPSTNYQAGRQQYRRRRLSLERVTYAPTNSSPSSSYRNRPLSHLSTHHRRRSNSLLSLNEVSQLSSPLPSWQGNKKNESGDRVTVGRETNDELDLSRSLVKFVNDEPSCVAGFDSTCQARAHFRPGILRIRNPSESSEIVSFRSSSASPSSSMSSSTKKVHFAQPLLTYAIFDGS